MRERGLHFTNEVQHDGRPYGAEADGRDDPTLIWTRSPSPEAAEEIDIDIDIEIASPGQAVLGWQSLAAVIGSIGAVLLMGVLIVDAPRPDSKVQRSLMGTDVRAALDARPSLQRSDTAVTDAAAMPDMGSQPAAHAQADALPPLPEPEAVSRPATDAQAPRARAPRHRHATNHREIAREADPTLPLDAPAPAETHTERASVDERTSGTLRINSLPWAEIYLDGKFVGTTPQAHLPVKAGRHRVKLVNPPLAMSKSFVVDVRHDQVVTRSINLSL